MANDVPNSFKAMVLKGQIDGDADTFKMILMASGFVFDKDTHHAYANVSAHETANGAGYTTGGVALSGVSIVTDDSGNIATISWSDAQWNSTGTLIASGAIIYDDSTDTSGGDDYTDAVVAYIDAGSLYTVANGAPLIIRNISISL